MLTDYLVVGIYADNHQRYAQQFQAASPEGAEKKAQRHVSKTGETLIIAAVIDSKGEVVS